MPADALESLAVLGIGILLGYDWIVILRQRRDLRIQGRQTASLARDLYEASGRPKDEIALSMTCDREAFVCGHTDKEGESRNLYVTDNPHEGYAWIVGRRCEIVDALMVEGRDAEARRVPFENKDGDYDEIRFPTGNGLEEYWMERVEVLSDEHVFGPDEGGDDAQA